MFYDDLLYSLIIGFAGAALFLLVDRLESNRAMGGLLKFLVLFVSGVVIMHRLRSYGILLNWNKISSITRTCRDFG
jgi:hypothetical protein